MKKKVTIFTYGQKYSFQGDFDIYHNVNFLPTTDESKIIIPICEQEVEIELPDGMEKNLTELEIKELEKMRDKVKADTVIKVKAIEDKIQSLLAIEFKD